MSAEAPKVDLRINILCIWPSFVGSLNLFQTMTEPVKTKNSDRIQQRFYVRFPQKNTLKIFHFFVYFLKLNDYKIVNIIIKFCQNVVTICQHMSTWGHRR
jgi:hypothetical protein